MRVRAILLSVIAAVVTASCVSEDSAPVHLKIDYQLRCVASDMCMALPDEDPHVLNGIDGLEGLTLDCEIGSDVTDFGFLVVFEGGEISLDSNDSECTLLVREDNTEFTKDCKIKEGGRANCTGSSLSAAQPCQVAVERDGDDVTGTLCCRSIPSGFGVNQPKDGDLSLVQSNTFDRPATFEMEHCR